MRANGVRGSRYSEFFCNIWELIEGDRGQYSLIGVNLHLCFDRRKRISVYTDPRRECVL